MQETSVQSLGWEVPLEKEMQSTPVFLPGEFQGQRSLAGYIPWGHKESDTIEGLTHIVTLADADIHKVSFHASTNISQK